MRKTIFLTSLICLAATSGAVLAEQIALDENHVQLAPGVIRAGKAIAYETEAGKWAVTEQFLQAVPEGAYRYQRNQAKLKVGLKDTFNSEWPLQVGYQGKEIRVSFKGLYCYNSATGALRQVQGLNPEAKTIIKGRGNEAGSRDVFSNVNVTSGITGRSLGSVFSLRDKSVLEGVKEGDTHLGILAELDLSSFAPYRIGLIPVGETAVYYLGSDTKGMTPEEIAKVTDSLVAVGEKDEWERIKMFARVSADYEVCFTLEGARGYDSKFDEKWTKNPALFMLKKMDGKDCLLELLPLDWLKQAVLPVSIEFSIGAGTKRNPDEEVLLAGNTYVFEGVYQTKSVTSLGEPGNPVVVKFLPESSIYITRPKGAGVRINNTVFTSVFDNQAGHGATVDPGLYRLGTRPAKPGDYNYALGGIAGKGSYIKNSQICYALRGIHSMPLNLENPISEVKNVLFENCSEYGALMVDWGNFVNNTIRNCGQGVLAKSANGMVFNSVFAQNEKLGCTELPKAASNNVFFGNAVNTPDGELGKDALSEKDGLTDPFAAGPGGDCYLNTTATGGARLVDSGFGNAQSFQAPELINMVTQTDKTGDTGTLDRGFHYPIIQ